MITAHYVDLSSSRTYQLFSITLLFLYVGILYPTGEPISLHRLRCSPFAVVHYRFMGYYLAATAISTRE